MRWPTCLRIPRAPDFVVGSDVDPYLRRWHVIPRNRFFNIYLHQFLRSDDDRAMHDHPWWNVSIVLRNAYIEHILGDGLRLCRAGSIVMRPAAMAHRVQLLGGSHPMPVWTLFITGRRVREWGFHCPKGWRHWKDFTNTSDGGRTVGPGCE